MDALCRAELASVMRTMDDGYPAMLIRWNNAAAARAVEVLEQLHSRAVHGSAG